MNDRQYNVLTFFVALEIVLGILAGLIFAENDPDRGENLMTSVFRFYATLFGIFFLVTKVLGTISLLVLKKKKILLKCIASSILTGLAVILFVDLASWFLGAILTSVLPLFGFVTGFNLTIMRDAKRQENVSGE